MKTLLGPTAPQTAPPDKKVKRPQCLPSAAQFWTARQVTPAPVCAHLPEGGDLRDGGSDRPEGGRRSVGLKRAEVENVPESRSPVSCPRAISVSCPSSWKQLEKFPVSPYRRLRWEVSLIASARKMERLISEATKTHVHFLHGLKERPPRIRSLGQCVPGKDGAGLFSLSGDFLLLFACLE